MGDQNTTSNINFHLTSITFNDGTKLDLHPNDIVVIVGPNNSGKSVSLREILNSIEYSDGRLPKNIVLEIESARSGSPDDVIAWLESHNKKEIHNSAVEYVGLDARVNEAFVEYAWLRQSDLESLTRFFCNFISTEERLQATKPVKNIDISRDSRNKPIQLLLDDINFEKNLSKKTQEAFDIPFFLNRWQGNMLSLLVGNPPAGEPWTREYSNKLSQIPEISEQGDGIRSFIGCVLELSIPRYFITMIDEPEAFLHPSSARILGRILAKDKRDNKQLFIATHSVDLLRGLLDAGTGNLRIIRITRDDDKNPIRELNPDDIELLWSDSLLRSSNILDGLFHEKVVVCESDSDSRFYSALSDSILDLSPGKYRPDVMFVSVGGKHRIHVVIKALMALGVDVRVIADFDILKEKNDIKHLVEAFGGNWNDFNSDWTKVSTSLNLISPPLNVNQTKQEIDKILESQKNPYLDEDSLTKIKDKLKMVSPWAYVKQSGKTAISSGDATGNYIDLEQKLRALGLFIVEVGELERFVPLVGGHGPAWVNKVLEKDLATDPELEIAREFIKKVLDLE